MSRSNIKAARQIRESKFKLLRFVSLWVGQSLRIFNHITRIFADESLQFRKQLLKGNGNSVMKQEAMTNLTQQTNTQLLEVCFTVFYDILHPVMKTPE